MRSTACGTLLQRTLSGFAAVCCLLFSVGCGPQDPAAPDDTLTTEQATSIFTKTTSRLTLPAGTEWTPLRTSEGSFRVAYTRDQAISAAESQWVCSWEKEWVQTYGTDDEAAEAAIDQLQTFPSTDEYKNQYGADLKKYFDQILLRAQLGDAAPMREEVEVNCP